MAYYCIHTAIGLQLLASAEATGTQIRLTHMAVGDGGGNEVMPTEGMTSLVRERFRATVNRVHQDPDNENMFTAELIIPADAAGFVIREIGVFDSNGNLFVVGNLPSTEKPMSEEGAYSDTVIRVPFMVSNASTVTLQIDPNVVIATQSWIINNINPAVLFPGGTTGQILKKKSNADGDTEWGDPNVADIVVDVIEERQILAGAQTNILLSVVTTRGIAVYVEGIRIPKGIGVDEWQPLASDPDTTIILGKSYPEGTRILLVQNEPTGAVPFPLIRDNNLSDVPDKQVGRENLGVFSKEESRANGLPAGAIIYHANNIPPIGYLKANGAAVSRTVYADLFASIGTRYGAGDGFNTFNIPDLRGEFIRGWDDGRGVDAGRIIGARQEAYSAIIPITGYGTTGNDGPGTIQAGRLVVGSGLTEIGETLESLRAARLEQTPTPGDTRPRNIALLACIKF